MPLIRYEIGDVANEGDKSYLVNETKIFLTTKSVLGRTLGFFKTKDGSLKHTHFLVQQFFYKNWIKIFQIIQKGFELIICKVVLSKEPRNKDICDIERNIKKTMGNNCEIKWEFVKDLKPLKSGKYLYTVNEII